MITSTIDLTHNVDRIFSTLFSPLNSITIYMNCQEILIKIYAYEFIPIQKKRGSQPLKKTILESSYRFVYMIPDRRRIQLDNYNNR